MSRDWRRSLFNHSTDNIVRRRLRPVLALRASSNILSSSSTRPRNSSHPPGNASFTTATASCARVIARYKRDRVLEHARAAIDDLVQSNTNNDETF